MNDLTQMQPVSEQNEENKGGMLLHSGHEQELTIDQDQSVTSLEESSAPLVGAEGARPDIRSSGPVARDARQNTAGEDRPYWHHQSDSCEAPDMVQGRSASPARALQSDTPMEQSAPHEVPIHSQVAAPASQASQCQEKGTGRNLQRIID